MSSIEIIRPDSATYVKDDFVSNDAVADATVGELNWELDTIANAPTLAYQTAQAHGVLRHTTAAVASGDGGTMRTFTDGLVISPGMEFGARVSITTLAGNNFRIGVDDSVTATSPTVGVWFDCDAGVMTLQVDSAANGDESGTVTGHPDLTSGTTLVTATMTDFYFKCSNRANANGGPDEVDFYINKTHVGKVPCNIGSTETAELKIAHWQDSGGAAARVMDIDYVYLYVPRTAR